MKHRMLALLASFFLLQNVFAQNAWQNWVHDFSTWLVEPMDDGGLVSAGFYKNATPALIRLSPTGGLMWSRRLVLEDSTNFSLFYSLGLAVLDNNEVAIATGVSKKPHASYDSHLLSVVDNAGNIVSSTTLSQSAPINPQNILFRTHDNKIVSTCQDLSTSTKSDIDIDCLNNDLTKVWAKRFATTYSAHTSGYAFQSAANDFILHGSLFEQNTPIGDFPKGGFILKLDELGKVKMSKRFPAHAVIELKQLASGDFLAMHFDTSYFHSYSCAIPGSCTATLTKLDSNFVEVWSKQLPGDFFNSGYFNNLTPSPDGGFYLKDAPFTKKTPQISRYDGNGNPVWQRRYSNCANLDFIANEVGKDGSLVGTFISVNNNYRYIFYKMTPDGHLGCPDSEIPLALLDVPVLPMENLIWTVKAVPLPPAKKLFSVPVSMQLEDFCPSDAFPVAHFEMQDTVCRNVKFQPNYDGNGVFDQLSWRFENGMPDSSNLTTAIESQFEAAGDHLIQLVQRFGACADTFQKSVHATGAQIDLGQDTSLCDGQTVTFQPLNLSDFTFFEWENGTTTPARTIAQTQLVAIRATTLAGCVAADTVLVSVVPIPDFLPDDTTACAEKQVFVKIPGNFNGTFFWNGNLYHHGDLLPLLAGDNHFVATSSEGCEWSEILLFLPKNCQVNIYAPNVFSPDGDGQNDGFQLYASPGVSKIRRFQIFDRVGELLFDVHDLAPDDPKIAWDGRFRGKKCAPQVFVWWAEIETSDGRSAVLKGDFLLAR